MGAGERDGFDGFRRDGVGVTNVEGVVMGRRREEGVGGANEKRLPRGGLVCEQSGKLKYCGRWKSAEALTGV